MRRQYQVAGGLLSNQLSSPRPSIIDVWDNTVGLQEWASVGPIAPAKEDDQGANLPLLWVLEGVLSGRPRLRPLCPTEPRNSGCNFLFLLRLRTLTPASQLSFFLLCLAQSRVICPVK